MSVLEIAIGWLAPSECIGCSFEGAALCQNCQLTEIIPYGERCYNCNKMSPNSMTCAKCRPGSPSYVWVCTDYEKLAKDLVQKLKFSHQRAAAIPLAQLMTDTLLTFVADDEIRAKNYLIIPVPTATGRVRERSFDHTVLLARCIAKNISLEVRFNLKRLGQSRQVGAKRSVRQAQATGNYYLNKPQQIKGRNILLIDDVVTTGATLRAATRVLRQAGAKSVDALVFAKKL